jgi:hypothetical protein
VNSGSNVIAQMPVKHFVMQAAMTTHLSQSTGIAAFDGQHGISLAIPSVMTIADISSATAATGPSDGTSAIAGRDIGANASPVISKIETSRRMVTYLFTPPGSHKTTRIDSLAMLTTS